MGFFDIFKQQTNFRNKKTEIFINWIEGPSSILIRLKSKTIDELVKNDKYKYTKLSIL